MVSVDIRELLRFFDEKTPDRTYQTTAICPNLQSGQLLAPAMLTEGNQRLVIAQSSGEADQDEGCKSSAEMARF